MSTTVVSPERTAGSRLTRKLSPSGCVERRSPYLFLVLRVRRYPLRLALPHTALPLRAPTLSGSAKRPPRMDSIRAEQARRQSLLRSARDRPGDLRVPAIAAPERHAGHGQPTRRSW